jgi:hypothetical protein
VVSQPPFKNTTEPVAGQVGCASSRSGPRHLGSRSPTDSSNIPEFGPWWQIIRPVAQLAQGIKKRENLLDSPSSLLLWFVLLTLTYHIRNQEGLSNKPAVHRIITLRLCMKVSHCFKSLFYL